MRPTGEAPWLMKTHWGAGFGASPMALHHHVTRRTPMPKTPSEAIAEPEPEIPPSSPKPHPLLSRRMINAYARTMGCGEFDPTDRCEHRIMSERFLQQLINLYEAEKP